MALSLRDAVAGLVDRDRRSIRWYTTWAAVVIIAGISVFFCSQFLRNLSAAHVDAIIKVGGGFIASLSVFPLKEVVERRQRVETLQWLLLQYEQQDDERVWLEDLIRERLRKEAGA